MSNCRVQNISALRDLVSFPDGEACMILSGNETIRDQRGLCSENGLGELAVSLVNFSLLSLFHCKREIIANHVRMFAAA